MFLQKNPKIFKGMYCVLTAFFLLSVPSSSNYMLKSYELDGSGGIGQSANYRVEADTAPLGGEQNSSTYSIDGGLIFTQQANVATATLTNGGDWYNKLLLTINPQNNPSDTVYAVAISTDNFTTTLYVQNDGTIGPSLDGEDWQTYSGWGSSSGFPIIGLAPGTEYKVKIKSRQGDFTEGPYGPVASGTTGNSMLSFDIDISGSDTETSAPYTVALGTLNAGFVTTATDKIWIDLSTNAENGGFVYIYDAYAGLQSAVTSYTISSSTTDLASAQEGYGFQVDIVSDLVAVSPYNGSSDNVGVVDTTIRTILNSGNAPVLNGRSSIAVKAKSSSQTPAANDYVDSVTIIATGSF